jgi:hypothetical protein
VGPGGLWLCFTALSASGLYRLNVVQLCVECSERGTSCSGPVRVLRGRLAEYLRGVRMERKGDQENTQANVPARISNTGMEPLMPPFEEAHHSSSGTSQTQVLVDLL